MRSLIPAKSITLWLLPLVVAACGAEPVTTPMTVTLTPSLTSPSPVGTVVTWTAAAQGPPPGTLWYRFRAGRAGGELRVVRDYGPLAALDWTAIDDEGAYQVEVSVRSLASGESAATTADYQLTSRVVDGQPVISTTANPLVFLYSAPACAAGSQITVRFSAVGVREQSTSAKPCLEGSSTSFYIAGLRPATQYTVRHTVVGGVKVVEGPRLTLATPEVAPVAAYDVVTQPPYPLPDGVLLQSPLFQPPLATDLRGNLLWVYSGPISGATMLLTRPEPGGLFWGILQDATQDSSRQVLRQVDLAGTTIRETNAARVSEQLAALGKHAITAFHHEARTLPDGSILTLGLTEQLLTDVQGPGAVNVLADTILVLDKNLQVMWAWEAMQHFDPRRAAPLGEICTTNPGCPPFYLTPKANDWLHGNSLQLTAQGDILYSVRHQDWLVKIDYNYGQGTGEILWRLGKDGDFRISSTDPSPWFSHQHDAQFESGGTTTLQLFDNGNTRRASDAAANSRGQVLVLDEAHRTATLALSVDLGAYSNALGSAQRLPNGDLHFDVGILPDGTSNTSRAVEVNSTSRIVYAMQANAPVYRSFRMADLYTP
jgi:arylsulfate sulfotransferase